MKKSLFVVPLLLVVIGGGAAWYLKSTSQPVKAPISTVKTLDPKQFLEPTHVEVEEGVLKVQHGEVEKTVEKSETLQAGDKVLVASGGLATIYWPDGSTSRVKGNAVVDITKALVDPNNIDTHVEANVESGEVWTKVLNMMTEDSSFEIKTKNTVAGIRGTEVYQKVTDTDEIVSTYEHGVELSVGNEPKITLVEGEQIQVKDKKSVLGLIPKEVPAWIQKAQQSDDEHLKQLAEKRSRLVSDSVDPAMMLMSSDQLIAQGAGATGETVMDQLVARALEAKQRGDVSALKAIAISMAKFRSRLQQHPEEVTPLLSEKMKLFQRLLLAGKVDPAEVTLREEFLDTRTALLTSPEEKEKLPLLLNRELFAAHDLMKQGEKDLARNMMESIQNRFGSEQDMLVKAPDIQKNMADRMTKKMMQELQGEGEDTAGMSAFRTHFLLEKVLDKTNGNMNSASQKVQADAEHVQQLVKEKKIAELKIFLKSLPFDEQQTLIIQFNLRTLLEDKKTEQPLAPDVVKKTTTTLPEKTTQTVPNSNSSTTVVPAPTKTPTPTSVVQPKPTPTPAPVIGGDALEPAPTRTSLTTSK